VQERDAFPLSDRGDQEVGEADCPDPSAAPQCGLDFQRAVPVLVMGGQPFVTLFPVGPNLVEFSSIAGCPGDLELDDTAGRDQPGLDERA